MKSYQYHDNRSTKRLSDFLSLWSRLVSQDIKVIDFGLSARLPRDRLPTMQGFPNKWEFLFPPLLLRGSAHGNSAVGCRVKQECCWRPSDRAFDIVCGCKSQNSRDSPGLLTADVSEHSAFETLSLCWSLLRTPACCAPEIWATQESVQRENPGPRVLPANVIDSSPALVL